MFNRLDKEKKGFISMKNLEDLMRDDKTYFQGKDASHIMEKYGSNGTMTFEQFQAWWGGTYTTYGNEEMNLGRLVDEVNAEQKQKQANPLNPIQEQINELELGTPHNSNVAVSRS